MVEGQKNGQCSNLLGLNIHNLTCQEALERIEGLIRHQRRSMVCFVNAHCVNVAYKDPEYRLTLQRAEMVLPDGSGLLLGSRILHDPIFENLNGTDLIPKLCAIAAKEGYSLYLLGGRNDVAEAAARNLVAKYPGLRIVGTHHGYFSETETNDIIATINDARPDILLVALGVPLQEKWIAANRLALDVGACFAVGGLFDFLSLRIRRAPEWMRKFGMEWFFRFLMEPRRMWRRYLVGNSVFLAHVARARLSKTVDQRSPLESLRGYYAEEVGNVTVAER